MQGWLRGQPLLPCPPPPLLLLFLGGLLLVYKLLAIALDGLAVLAGGS